VVEISRCRGPGACSHRQRLKGRQGRVEGNVHQVSSLGRRVGGAGDCANGQVVSSGLQLLVQPGGPSLAHGIRLD